MMFEKLRQKIKSVRLRRSHRFSYVQVLKKPEGWHCAGIGNSAAIFRDHAYPDIAIKVFSDACGHIADEESRVYRQLGDSPFHPKLYGSGENFLLLQYVPGPSVYECLLRGTYIPEQVVRDIDNAISYARGQGLNPRNLHAKNILVHHQRGCVVDVSEYMKPGKCYHWKFLKYAYYHFYSRLCRPGMKIPFWVLEYLRRGYRVLKLTGIIRRR